MAVSLKAAVEQDTRGGLNAAERGREPRSEAVTISRCSFAGVIPPSRREPSDWDSESAEDGDQPAGRHLPAPSSDGATRVAIVVTLVLLGVVGLAALCCALFWIAVAIGLPVVPSP
jgi:hypothetical protein